MASNKPKKKGFLYLGIGGISILCVLLFALIGADFLSGIGRTSAISNLIDRYLRAMSNKNAELAYSYYSISAHNDGMTLDYLQSLFDGSHYSLYADYTSLGNISIASLAFSTDPNANNRTMARGEIFYEGGYVGDFEAVLEREGKDWKIYSIGINIPREKLNDFLSGS